MTINENKSSEENLQLGSKRIERNKGTPLTKKDLSTCRQFLVGLFIITRK